MESFIAAFVPSKKSFSNFSTTAGSSGVWKLCIFWWWIRTWGGSHFSTQRCFSASSGFSLFFGSISRHFTTKSVKSGSSSPITSYRGLPKSLRSFALEFFNIIGSRFWPNSLYLKNRILRSDTLIISFFGCPIISIIRDIWSCSLSPWKIG